MNEIISLKNAKMIMKNLNVIIYASIRDIEKDFYCCFTNIEKIASYFNKVLKLN